MLGWAIKKGFQGAVGGNDAPAVGEDTTQFEGPDTPAPVFAARAIKNAIWGAPAAPNENAPTERRRAELTTNAIETTDTNPNDAASPSKPTSILLTPGTGTARRKRVSFGHDVKAGNNVDSSPLAANSTRQRKRTTLQQALENSRSAKSKNIPEKTKDEGPAPKTFDDDSEGEWEDDVCNHDVTVDLNEPHSESGRYWKSEFDRYRDEAKSDIERLVKYKALAKSFAAKKDAEANDLGQKLKEEQAKAAKMEEKITDMAARIADKRRRGADKDNAALMEDLAKQTTLALQYRDQVKDLETLLKESQRESSSGRSNSHRINTSPRTEQTILEVNRELRKARSELKQMDRLREEVKQLKSNLASSQKRVAKLEERKVGEEGPESSRVQRLESQLREAKEEARHKDRDMRKLKRDYDSLKEGAKARTVEAMQVLQEKNNKIAELEKIIKSLEAAANTSSSRPKSLDAVIAEHNRITRDLKSDIESLSKPSKHDTARPVRLPKRPASLEDITLDMTQRSLLGEKSELRLEDIPKENRVGRHSSDWTASLLDMDEQLKKGRKDRMEAKKRGKNLIMEDDDVASPQPTLKKASLPSSDSRRVMSDVFADRLNGASPKESGRRHRVAAKEPFSSNYYQDKISRRVASARTAPPASDKATMHGALDKPASRARHQSNTSRPLSPGSEAPDIDLLQDHFARLGGPEPERNTAANASRCALPADRQAAARARLQQKRMERKKTSGGSRVVDKENVEP